MALEEVKVINQITVAENGSLSVREVTRIIKDGEMLTEAHHYLVFTPGSDMTSMPANVQAIAAAAWTPEVVAAFQAQQSEA